MRYGPKLLIINLLLCPWFCAFGQVKPVPVPPVKPENSKQAYILESSRTVVNFESDGSATSEVSSQYRVLSQVGVDQLGLLVFTYSDANQKLKIDFVNVRQPDGMVIQTPLNSVQDMPAAVSQIAPMYSDLRQKHVPVKGLAVGDVLEYRYELQTFKPLIKGEFWFDYTFAKTGIVKDEELQISFPKGQYVKVKSPGFSPVISNQGNRTSYVWKSSNSGGEAESQPAAKSPLPSVEITTFRSWPEVGRWWEVLARQAATPTPEIRAKAAELTKGLTTDDAKIRALYRFVSTQYRYISLSFGIGRYKPHAAGDVLSNMYGDCKDKHVLLASLLNAVGLEAWPALINSRREIDPDIPSPSQFDHVITVVPEGKNFIWLDTTPQVAPFAFLLAPLRGKKALLMPAGKDAYLAETPAEPPFRGSQLFQADATLGADGVLNAKIHRTLRGDQGVMARLLFNVTPPARWQQVVQGLSYLSGFGGKVSNINVGDPESTGEAFHLSYDYTRKNYADWAHQRTSPPMARLLLPDWTDDAAKASKSLKLGAPGSVTFKSSVALPKGYTPALPAAVSLNRPFASYQATYSFKNGVLYVERDLMIKEAKIPISDRAGYKSFRKAVNDDQGQFISLSNGQTAAKAKKPAPIDPHAIKFYNQAREAFMMRDTDSEMDNLQQALKLAPKFAGAWVALGGLYLRTHRIDEGIAAYHKAIQIDPKDVRPYRALATALMFLRREHEAIDVWQSLLKQDPNDGFAHAALGQLLLKEKQYKAAATELHAALKQDSGSALLEARLGDAEIGDGDIQAATAAYRQAVKLDPSPSVLNSAAYGLAEHGVALPEAERLAQRAIQADEQQAAKMNMENLEASDLALMVRLAQEWDTLGWVYFRMGKFPDARNYLNAAWNLDQVRTIADHLGALDEKLGRKQAALHMYALAEACPTGVYGESDPNLARLDTSNKKREILVNQARAELSSMRRDRLGKVFPRESSAQFLVLFAPGGKIEGVKFASGADALRPLAKAIAITHFKVPLPDNAPAKILRRGMVVCYGSGFGCDFLLLPPETVHSLN